MSHQVFRPDRWPLFEVRTTELDSGTLLHLSIDLLFVDFWSIQLLVKEYMQLVSDPDPYLPPLDLSFRDYVLFTARQRESSAYRRPRTTGASAWTRCLVRRSCRSRSSPPTSRGRILCGAISRSTPRPGSS